MSVIRPGTLVVLEVPLERSQDHPLLHAGTIHVVGGLAPVIMHGALSYCVDELLVIADAGELPPERLAVDDVVLQ